MKDRTCPVVHPAILLQPKASRAAMEWGRIWPSREMLRWPFVLGLAEDTPVSPLWQRDHRLSTHATHALFFQGYPHDFSAQFRQDAVY